MNEAAVYFLKHFGLLLLGIFAVCIGGRGAAAFPSRAVPIFAWVYAVLVSLSWVYGVSTRTFQPGEIIFDGSARTPWTSALVYSGIAILAALLFCAVHEIRRTLPGKGRIRRMSGIILLYAAVMMAVILPLRLPMQLQHALNQAFP